MSESDKDLEIMVLRYQLGIAERKMQKPVRANRAERMTLAVLAGRLKQQTGWPANQFRQLIRLVQPETVFRWHRDLVRRKWTQDNTGKRGRPRIDDRMEHLIVRLAKENLRWARSVRQECLDHVLILSEGHLRRVLQTYIEYYNTGRPHQSLEQQSPIPYPEPAMRGAVEQRQLLSGVLNDYFWAPGNNGVAPRLS